MSPLVTVTIVTHNSRGFIPTCLESLQLQRYHPLEIILVDNGSGDGSADLAARHAPRVRVIRNSVNIGFAAGQNQAIAAGHGDWFLTLNPDVRLEPDFIKRLVETGTSDQASGVACGKLLRATPELEIPAERRIDSTGVYFTPCARHFDRGWNEPDDGRYREPEYVFGACAAAALYRREMIADVSLGDGFFDPDFFAYREDADVAWRAQLLGWRCVYVPEAVGYHVRRVLPNTRRGVPSALKMHSVKNRFLMRVKNMTPDLYRRHWFSVSLRDLMVVGGCLLAEPSSLPGLWRAARHLPSAWAKRRQIMQRRAVSDEYMAAWFCGVPASQAREVPREPSWEAQNPGTARVLTRATRA